jgi:GT2 family glycosyltransferase
MRSVGVFAASGSDASTLRTILDAEPNLSVTYVDESNLSSALDSECDVAILFFASPLTCATRLIAAEGCSRVQALARYDHYLRCAVAALEGRTVAVLVEELSNAELANAVAALRTGRAIRLPITTEERAASPTEPVPDAIHSLWSTLRSRGGVHEHFSAVQLTSESEWTTEVLALSLELSQLQRALLFTAEQLATVLEIDPDAPITRTSFSTPDEPDQFHEAADGEPYRLNASEDRKAYQQWLAWKRQPDSVGGQGDPPLRKAATRSKRHQPALISVVVPVYKTPIWALERCVGSVLAQSFANWELCLCDDASNEPELASALRTIARLDRRISVVTSANNGGISVATNAAVHETTGEFIAFLDHDDELAPDALEKISEVIAADAEADLIYTDEDKIDLAGDRFDPFFKPEWSPDLLLSFAYMSHLSVIRRSLFTEVGGLRREFDGSQDYDLTLRASEGARHIVHIPEVLYHWRSMPGSAAADTAGQQAKPWAYEAGRRAIEDALQRRGEPGAVSTLEEFPGRYHVRRSIKGRPLVSIIIPFRDEPALLATCTRTLRDAPGYDNYELILVDNDSALPETLALLEELALEPHVRILQAPGPFNWAAINNAAASASSGELLLFLNNDIEAKVPGWLDAMVGHAQRDEVGAVGARLLYPDGTIQHAGVVIGLGGIAGHVLRGLPGHQPGYASLAISTRNCSVVTGAAMMVRREVFFEIGGFDETLAVAFNDVDFCLKLRERGFLIVFSPLTELIHHESKSRGHTDDVVENKLMLTRWRGVMVNGDPYHNPHLSHWRYWCPLSTAQEDDRWKNYLETRILTLDSSSNE